MLAAGITIALTGSSLSQGAREGGEGGRAGEVAVQRVIDEDGGFAAVERRILESYGRWCGVVKRVFWGKG